MKPDTGNKSFLTGSKVSKTLLFLSIPLVIASCSKSREMREAEIETNVPDQDRVVVTDEGTTPDTSVPNTTGQVTNTVNPNTGEYNSGAGADQGQIQAQGGTQAADGTLAAGTTTGTGTTASTGTTTGTDTTATANTTGTAPDNTGVNQRDRNGESPTPMDQSNNQADLKITQDIRREIVDNPSLSMNADNIKIITEGGVVTLRGPVKTAEEKQAIEQIVKQVPNVGRVNNQLEVTSRSS